MGQRNVQASWRAKRTRRREIFGRPTASLFLGNSYTPTRSAVTALRTPSARGMGRPGRPIFVCFLCFCFFIHFHFSFFLVFSFTALYYDFEFCSATKKKFRIFSYFKNYILKFVRILKFVHISKIVQI
jgi:hypothetical protein